MPSRSWRDLDGEAAGRVAVVVGNGPSRRGRWKVLRQAIAADRAVVIACNAYWREQHRDRWPSSDYLVCYDGRQAEMAAPKAFSRILVPEQRDDPVRCELEPDACHRTYVAAPHKGTADVPDYLDPAWHPRVAALGNLSGLLAFQLALLLGCRRVRLLGVDCAGILSGGRVSLSSVGEGTPGYGPGDAPLAACVPVGEAMLPRQWEQTRSCWRALTRRAEDLGVHVTRMTDGGALDWIEVEPAAEGAWPSTRSRTPTSG